MKRKKSIFKRKLTDILLGFVLSMIALLGIAFYIASIVYFALYIFSMATS